MWDYDRDEFYGDFDLPYEDDLYEWETNQVYADLAAGEYDID